MLDPMHVWLLVSATPNAPQIVQYDVMLMSSMDTRSTHALWHRASRPSSVMSAQGSKLGRSGMSDRTVVICCDDAQPCIFFKSMLSSVRLLISTNLLHKIKPSTPQPASHS